MSLAHWMAIAALAAAYGGATAQEKPLPPAPAAAAPVKYASAFDGYRQMEEGNAPSIEVWRAANDQVKTLGGHAGHMKAASNGASTASTPEGATAPAAGKAMPADHGNHGMDHQTEGK